MKVGGRPRVVQCNAHRSAIIDNVIVQYYCCWLQVQQLQATFDVVDMCACVCACVCMCIPRPSPCQSAAHLLVLSSIQDGPSSFSDATNPTPTGPVLGTLGTVRLASQALDMVMGAGFGQGKRQKATGQTGRQRGTDRKRDIWREAGWSWSWHRPPAQRRRFP